METKTTTNNLFEKEGTILDYEQLLNNNIMNIPINGFNIKKDKETILNDNRVNITKYTDYEHPFVIIDSELCINIEWYNSNKEKAITILTNIIKNYKDNEFTLYSIDLINEDIINAIITNPDIDTLNLGERFGTENRYILTEELYNKLKQSHIKSVVTGGVEPSLKEVFDPLIDFNYNKCIIETYTYSFLSKFSYLDINKSLNEEELYNFKFLRPDGQITIKNFDFNNIENIINRLRELNSPIKVLIEIKDKELFNQEIAKYIDNPILEDERLYVKINSVELDIKHYIRLEQMLYEMVKDAINLSPFEKYIYAYNKVKQFKEYKEIENDSVEERDKSRNIYYILENDYMVCVGFSNLLGDLLIKLGIPSEGYSIDVDTSYDEGKVNEEKVVTRAGHQRRYVHIKDDKYGIDGYYVTDPTWDNDLKKDLYNHLAMTDEEMNATRRYNFFNNKTIYELFNSKSIEEFYQKINFLIDKEIKSLEEKPSKEEYKNLVLSSIIGIIKNITNRLKTIDIDFYNEIKTKYDFIDNLSVHTIKQKNINIMDIDLLYDLGMHIITKTNNIIPGETIIKAVRELYEKVYGYKGEELDRKIQEIIKNNKEAQAYSFPKRIMEREDGSYITLYDENKFDIEDNNSIRR